MVQLGDIPTEVLLKIAEQLASDPRHARYSQHNLCKLALTSRKLRPIAQEALHRSIVVRTLDPSDVRDDRGQSCFPARTALLCRTLLERKDLAEKVRCLQLVVWGEGSKNLNLHETDGKTQCGIQCSPRWIELMSLCRAHILSESVPWANRTVRNAWLERLHPGCRTDETVLAGVILSCTSSLRHLRLVPLRNIDWWNPGSDGFELLEDWNMDPYGGCCSWVLVVKELFGGSYLGENFALATVPGFSSLESLDCTEVLPWEILRLPKLQRLRFALDTDIEYEKYVDTTCIYPSPPSREMFPASLKTLILDVEVAIFNDSLRSMAEQRYSWFYDICLPRLPALKHLELRSRCSWFEYYLFSHSLGFHNATISLCHEGLETLVVQLCDALKTKEPVDIAPALNITSNLPKLRRIVGPQELYFDYYWDSPYCELPPSIESIELIGMSDKTKYYVQRLLQMTPSYPRLNKIVIWSNPMSAERCKSEEEPWASLTAALSKAGVGLSWESSEIEGWCEE